MTLSLTTFSIRTIGVTMKNKALSITTLDIVALDDKGCYAQ
jgi:hypothetical protein